MKNFNIKSFDFDVIYDKLISGCGCFDDDEVDMIFSALKKVYIPEKVTENGYGVYFCPVCSGSVWQCRDESKYCFRCGQALDWSDENECNFPYELTQNNINEVVAFLNSMTAEDWEKLHKDVEEELINDMCYDDCDTFIFIG